MNRAERRLGPLVRCLCVVVIGCGGTSSSDTVPPTDNVIALSDLSVTTAEDAPITVPIPVTASRPQDVVLSAKSGPSHGSISADGTLWTYTPATGFNGIDEVVIEAQDAFGAQYGQASATLTINVKPVEHGPLAVDDIRFAAVGTAITIEESALLANDRDPERNPLSLVSVQNGDHGSAVIQGTDVVFTPEADFAGTASFLYTISDGRLTATATVHVLCVRPPIAGDDSIAIVNTGTGGAEQFTLADFVLLRNDTDPEGRSLRIRVGSITDAIARNTSGDSFVAATITLSGNTLHIQPVEGYSGIVHFSYEVTNGFVAAKASVTLDLEPWKRSGDVSVRMSSDPKQDIGDTRTYEITVSGPTNEFVYVDVDAPIPDGLTCTWTCMSGRYGQCTASGSGGIKETVRMNTSLSYELTCKVSGPMPITNSVTVTPPDWFLFTDTDRSNNTFSVSR